MSTIVWMHRHCHTSCFHLNIRYRKTFCVFFLTRKREMMSWWMRKDGVARIKPAREIMSQRQRTESSCIGASEKIYRV